MAVVEAPAETPPPEGVLAGSIPYLPVMELNEIVVTPYEATTAHRSVASNFEALAQGIGISSLKYEGKAELFRVQRARSLLRERGLKCPNPRGPAPNTVGLAGAIPRGVPTGWSPSVPVRLELPDSVQTMSSAARGSSPAENSGSVQNVGSGVASGSLSVDAPPAEVMEVSASNVSPGWEADRQDDRGLASGGEGAAWFRSRPRAMVDFRDDAPQTLGVPEFVVRHRLGETELSSDGPLTEMRRRVDALPSTTTPLGIPDPEEDRLRGPSSVFREMENLGRRVQQDLSQLEAEHPADFPDSAQLGSYARNVLRDVMASQAVLAEICYQVSSLALRHTARDAAYSTLLSAEGPVRRHGDELLDTVPASVHTDLAQRLERTQFELDRLVADRSMWESRSRSLEEQKEQARRDLAAARSRPQASAPGSAAARSADVSLRRSHAALVGVCEPMMRELASSGSTSMSDYRRDFALAIVMNRQQLPDWFEQLPDDDVGDSTAPPE